MILIMIMIMIMIMKYNCVVAYLGKNELVIKIDIIEFLQTHYNCV